MHEPRRSRRVLASLPLEIHTNGDVIAACTAVINLHGALILCSVKWPQGSQLTLKNPENGMAVAGRVVWSGDVAPGGLHKLGVEFEFSSPQLWGAHYDPDRMETPEHAAALEKQNAEKEKAGKQKASEARTPARR